MMFNSPPILKAQKAWGKRVPTPFRAQVVNWLRRLKGILRPPSDYPYGSWRPCSAFEVWDRWPMLNRCITRDRIRTGISSHPSLRRGIPSLTMRSILSVFYSEEVVMSSCVETRGFNVGIMIVMLSIFLASGSQLSVYAIDVKLSSEEAKKALETGRTPPWKRPILRKMWKRCCNRQRLSHEWARIPRRIPAGPVRFCEPNDTDWQHLGVRKPRNQKNKRRMFACRRSLSKRSSICRTWKWKSSCAGTTSILAREGGPRVSAEGKEHQGSGCQSGGTRPEERWRGPGVPVSFHRSLCVR